MHRFSIATLAVALLVPAGLAKANTYDVYACWAGAGTFHNPNVSTAAWLKDHSHEGGRFAVNDSSTAPGTGGYSGLKIVKNQFRTLSHIAGLTDADDAVIDSNSLTGIDYYSIWAFGGSSDNVKVRNNTDNTSDFDFLFSQLQTILQLEAAPARASESYAGRHATENQEELGI